jgi:hypothetical protein
MAQIDIADAAMAGVRLTVRKPLTVLSWGVVMVAFIAVMFALFGTTIFNSITALVKSGQTTPSPQLILGLIGSLFGFLGLLVLGAWAISTVLIAAALRSELDPAKGAFAYLRLGGQELWVLGVTFVLGLVLFAAAMVMAIPLGILTMMMALGSITGGGAPTGVGGLSQAFASMFAVRIIGQLIIQVVILWLWCRLAPGVVMSFKEREFRLFESWNLTKGHAWRIFLSMLLVYLIMIAIGIVAYIIIIAVAFGTIASVPGINDPATFFARPASEWIGIFGPTAVAVVVVMVLTTGVSIALRWAALANIYKQLQPPAAVAETFA